MWYCNMFGCVMQIETTAFTWVVSGKTRDTYIVWVLRNASKNIFCIMMNVSTFKINVRIFIGIKLFIVESKRHNEGE